MEFINTFEFQVVLRLVLGFILAGIIGAEREYLNKPAGFKTHALIGTGAVLLMLCGEHLSIKNGLVDASRIPAQLLSGIGFIGAGTILRDGFNVKGLTTAASLLIVTCVGLSIGAGFYLGGIIVTLIAYVILSYSHKIFNKTEYDNVELVIKLEKEEALSEGIQKVFKSYDIEIKTIKNPKQENEKKEIHILCKHKKDVEINEVIAKISEIGNVLEVGEM